MGFSRTIWVWKMAWRDGRAGRKKLLLAALPVVLGVASLVAISSYGKSLESAIQQQSKALLGADLSLESRQPLSHEAEALIVRLGGEQSRQTGFSSMIHFPKNGATQLAQIRALEGNFPYYGVLETDPLNAAQSFQQGPNALVDEGLLVQHDIQVGDSISIGNSTFRITGKLKKIPGETLAAAMISPRVYIPLRYLDRTQLLQKGSIVRYRTYFKLNPNVDADRLVQNLTPELRQLRLEADTVSRRKAAISRAFENLSRFLNFVGFSAVLLAGLGVASAIYVYARNKIATTAILRCIGAKANHAFAVYVLQAASVGVVGTALGTLIGIGAQAILPRAVKDFIPSGVAFSFSLSGVALGAMTGLGFALLFSLLPLCSLRKVSPLLSLRSSYEHMPPARDPLVWAIHALLLTAIVIFAWVHTGRWLHALIFTASFLGALGVLIVLARAVAVLLKRFLAPSWPYVWRQGLANLHRPNNQTTVLMLSIGLVTALIVTAYLTRSMIMDQIAERSGENEPNMVFFDVQFDQAESLVKLIRSLGLRLYQDVPVVTMRLAAVKGVRVAKLRDEARTRISPWALRREYRSTYRDQLTSTETIVAGTWPSTSTPGGNVPVSLEKDIAETLGVTLGDELTFDIDGVPIVTTVSSIREVDWHRVQPNFFVVFPRGVLEDAPQFRVLAARADSNDASVRAQRAVVRAYPNVSVIDIRLILATVDAVLEKVAFAVRTISGFIILTAALVLVGAIVSSYSQRLKETVLFRTLGASRSQILKIHVAEYLCLGICGGLSGIVLGVLASWGLSYYFFASLSMPPLGRVFLSLLVVALVTVAAGVLGCVGIFKRSPLEALRAEF